MDAFNYLMIQANEEEIKKLKLKVSELEDGLKDVLGTVVEQSKLIHDITKLLVRMNER